MAEKCGRLECEADAIWRPVVVVHAPVKNSPPAEGLMGELGLCEEHKDPDPDMYVSDVGWSHISDAMAAQGLMRPKRSKTRIKFVRIGSREEKRSSTVSSMVPSAS